MSFGLEYAHVDNQDLAQANGGPLSLSDFIGNLPDLANAAGNIIGAINGTGNQTIPNGAPAATVQTGPVATAQNAINQVPPWAWIAGAGVLGVATIIALK